jgi:hypothetical protein
VHLEEETGLCLGASAKMMPLRTMIRKRRQGVLSLRTFMLLRMFQNLQKITRPPPTDASHAAENVPEFSKKITRHITASHEAFFTDHQAGENHTMVNFILYPGTEITQEVSSGGLEGLLTMDPAS